MADRILIWHIPRLPAILPVYYADCDYTPKHLRIYAERAPDSNLVVDILDDGVSLMNSNELTKTTIKNEDAYIEYGTPSGTFTVHETVSGTSGASAKVKSNVGGRLTLYDVGSTAFVVGETITGASSTATGVVNYYVRGTRSVSHTPIPGRSLAGIVKGASYDNAAEDFKPGADIHEGSWVSLSLLDAGGASNITVQLELESAGESSYGK
jgi:hypothetical protein